jgi:hypothetical protein
MQNLPTHVRSPIHECKKNVEKFLGIGETRTEPRPLPAEPKRARPKSLGLVGGRSLDRRVSQDETSCRQNDQSPATLNR